MKFYFRLACVFFGLLILLVSIVDSAAAQEDAASDQSLEQLESLIDVELADLDEATESGAASSSAEEATPSAGIVRKITEKSSDLTETQGEAKGKLERLVLETPVGPVGVTNFLRWSIREAVTSGVPANTIVLVLMFPIVTALIAASRHLVGLRGFGLFTPAIVSVGFLATGLTTGFFLFFIILAIATAGRVIIRRLKMPYMPRTSLLLWLVSIGVLLLLLISPYLRMHDLAQLSIFPILLMVLLAERFIEVQIKRSRSEAIEMTLETLLLAVLSYFVMNLELVQELVILNPELVLVVVAVFNVFMGRFSGLRLMEYWRFRRILD